MFIHGFWLDTLDFCGMHSSPHLLMKSVMAVTFSFRLAVVSLNMDQSTNSRHSHRRSSISSEQHCMTLPNLLSSTCKWGKCPMVRFSKMQVQDGVVAGLSSTRNSAELLWLPEWSMTGYDLLYNFLQHRHYLRVRKI